MKKSKSECLNASKTDVILLGRKATLEPLNFPGICVEAELVSPSKCVRDLGLHLDQSLSMEPHVNKIRAAVFSRFRTEAFNSIPSAVGCELPRSLPF